MTETQGKNPHEITNALKHSKPVIEAFANKKIKEMEAERDQLGDTLLSHFRHTATEDAQGKHFSVKVIHGENGEEPKLESKPLK
jgi:hypothetical protein